MNLKILGAGITALSIAHHLEKAGSKDFELFEAAEEPGGLCRTKNRDGFLIDYAVHTIFTSNPYVNELYEEFLRGNMLQKKSLAKIYFENKYIDYPFQGSLHEVSEKVQQDCLTGIIAARETEHEKPKNFGEWIEITFGTGIANHFLIPYNEKKFGMRAHEMDTEFISWRCPEVSVEEVRNSIERPLGKEFGYNPNMRYPANGGFDELIKAFTSRISSPIHTEHSATEIDTENRTVKFENGKETKYETLVSTIPLPELVKITKDVPAEISALAKKLKNQPVWVYSFGITKPPKKPFYWAYYGDADISFVRLSIPSAFSDSVAPKGKHLLQVECSEEFTPERVIKDMIKVGVLDRKDDVCLIDENLLEYGYVQMETSHPEIIAKITDWFKERGIHCVGRFGAWRYLNADECIQAGKDFADSVGGG